MRGRTATEHYYNQSRCVCVVWTDVADAGAGVAEDHHGGAVVVVHEGPEVGAGAGHGPLRHDVLPGVGVALHNTPLIFCTTQICPGYLHRQKQR